jgi:hypothetical protein
VAETGPALVGRVAPTEGSTEAIPTYHVEARRGDAVLVDAVTDRTGHFRLPLGGQDRVAIHVVATTPSGIPIGEARLPLDEDDHPDEIIFSAPLRTEPTERFDLEAPAAPEPVVPVRTVERLYRAVGIAVEGGAFTGPHGLFGGVGWVHHVERELEDLEQIAGRVALGEVRLIGRLRLLLQRAPEGDLPVHAHQEPEAPLRAETCVRPHDAAAVVAAAVMLELLDGRDGRWPERAAALYISRLAAVERALMAAGQALAGSISYGEFAAAATAASPYPHHGDGHGMDGDEGRAHHMAGQPLGPCARSVAHCFSQMIEAARASTGPRDVPVPVGAVKPRAVCARALETVRLLPVEGERFAPRGGGETLAGLVLWDGLDARPLKVVSAGRQAIEVELPGGLRGGCACLAWRPPAPSLAQRIAEAVEHDEHCRPFLARRTSVPVGWPCLASVSVRGDPRVTLRANGRAGEATAPACAEVLLEWAVDAAACDGTVDARTFRARLLAGDRVLLDSAPPAGSLTVSDGEDMTFVLETESSDGERRCGSARAEVRVRRRGELSLETPRSVFYPSEAVLLTVRLSCAATAEVRVDVASSDPTIIPGAEIRLPAGEVDETVELAPPGPLGTVTLTATVPDGRIEYAPGEVEVTMAPTSCIEGDPRFGGRWDEATVSVTEPGDACPPRTSLQNAGADQHAKAGTRLLNAGTEVKKAFGCFSAPDTTSADLARCDAWKEEQDAARGQWVETRREECAQWRDEGYNKCTEQRDQGYNKCTEQRDQGYNKCTEQRDEGYNACCDWAPCSWFCNAWVWISNIVCVAWTWISNIVCVAWTWVSNVVCVAWTWVSNVLCVAWTWIVDKVWIAGAALGHVACKGYAWVKNTIIGRILCFIGHIAAAVFDFAVALVHVFAGVLLKLGGVIVGLGCTVVNAVTGRGAGTITSAQLRVVGIHVAVLHTGKVLIFSYDEGVPPPVTRDNPSDPTSVGDSNRALCALWDPASGAASYLPLNRNLFCSGHCFAADGKLVVAGGQFPLPVLGFAPGADSDVHLFDPVAERWDRLPNMDAGRWYPTCTTQADGRVFVISGTNAWATMAGFFGGIQNSWLTIDPAARSVSRSTILQAPIAPAQVRRWKIYHLYPFVHVLPAGVAFVHYRRITRFFNPANGLWSVPLGGPGGSLYGSGGGGLELTQHPFSRTGPGPGTSVLLPLVPTRNSENGEVEYPAGKILILGGGGAEGKPEPDDKLFPTDDDFPLNPTTAATETAEMLDLDQRPGPTWRFTAPMRYRRVMPDAVLLPNGKVFVVNGGTTGQSGGFLSHVPGPTGIPDMGATGPVRAPEMFDPVTETWETLCEKRLDRLYHATAVLLPDARILVAGHDGFLNMEPYVDSRYELEVYSPPYLFNGPRPVISRAPARIAHGDVFEIETPDAADIGSAALIRQSSVTHQINTDQRYVGLATLSSAARDRIRFQAPPDGGVAPPGFYMLFIVTREGVPSVASWVQLETAAGVQDG